MIPRVSRVNYSPHCMAVLPGFLVNSEEFKYFRKRLNRTQKQIAELLGVSLKAIHSYEQGWRTVPAHVERQMFFLVSRLEENRKNRKPCWRIKKCPPEQKKKCPAWEFKAGKLCWFINGMICEGRVHKNWEEKMKICRSCEVLASLI
jgi:DNA-binding transcriptional regulator YiaG